MFWGHPCYSVLVFEYRKPNLSSSPGSGVAWSHHGPWALVRVTGCAQTAAMCPGNVVLVARLLLPKHLVQSLRAPTKGSREALAELSLCRPASLSSRITKCQQSVWGSCGFSGELGDLEVMQETWRSMLLQFISSCEMCFNYAEVINCLNCLTGTWWHPRTWFQWCCILFAVLSSTSCLHPGHVVVEHAKES